MLQGWCRILGGVNMKHLDFDKLSKIGRTSNLNFWLTLIGIVLLLTGCAVGRYRIPYEDGTVVFVESDFVTHDSPETYMYDLVAQNASPASVVAAANGVIRYIVDDNMEPTSDNNYVWIEHPQYQYECGSEVCTEWTVYAHFAKNSVTGVAGLSVGDTVSAGDFLGFESNVGVASFVHLHWHVAALPSGVAPTFNGYYLDYVIETGRSPELIPIVCHQDGEHVMWRDNNYVAAGCIGSSLLSNRVQLGFEHVRSHLRPGTPIEHAIARLSTISNEALSIAQADPELLTRTIHMLTKLRPVFDDLKQTGRARILKKDYDNIRKLVLEYQNQGSTRLHATLEPLTAMLENPASANGLGLIVWDPSEIMH